jgi:hypothetical protein
MSWSKTTTGKPTEVGDAVKAAILESANYSPPSERRQRTAQLVADGARKLIVGASEDRDTAPQREITVLSWGHIADDGALSSNGLTFSFVSGSAREAAEPERTAPGPDAITHEEVDAVVADIGEPANSEEFAAPSGE